MELQNGNVNIEITSYYFKKKTDNQDFETVVYFHTLLFAPDRGTKSLPEKREHSLSRLSAISKKKFFVAY